MLDSVVAEGRGDHMQTLSVAPKGRLWLGRLAPEIVVQNSRLGERSERLEPCEVGVRVRPTEVDGRTVTCAGRLVVWSEFDGGDAPDAPRWRKSDPIEVRADLPTPARLGESATSAGRDDFAAALRAVGADGMACEFQAELEMGKDGPELVVTLVNVSPEEIPGWDTKVYEAVLEVDSGPTAPFTLDNLPDSFRYDRTVSAYGVNGGVVRLGPETFRTEDAATHDQPRPIYWDDDAGQPPDLTFATLAAEPLPPLRDLVAACERWANVHWAPAVLTQRAIDEDWDAGMRDEADTEAGLFTEELERLRAGLALLERDDDLRRSFMLANQSFADSPVIRHTTWRPFQLGFMLANATSIVDDRHDGDRSVVDTLWFATGGGKTETYLLYVVTTAFYDRLRGKREGITSWGRFPLRMLSLQQTQRFADVIAAAELVRLRERIAGREFALGFLVGKPGTPNRIRASNRSAGDPDPTDPDMPARHQVLLRCPFCGSEGLHMAFDTGRWTLDHVCGAERCPWGARPLPFRVVDEEIFRSLPTVVLGTLDKAANIAMQAAMRGFYGAPSGRCPVQGHGFTYAPRSGSPGGCLFPGCQAQSGPLTQAADLYAPTVRMQDELHLLRDSLGAVDSHYEALLDALQQHYGSTPKVIASSATLAGHDEQVRALYRKTGRTFPRPGARAGWSFWSRATETLARRFAGLAPRGVTLEYATDQLTESLQRVTRRAVEDPASVAAEIGVDVAAIPLLVDNYGVDVVYGSNLKDVEAVARSFDTQIQLDRPVNAATLTGRTPLDEVRDTLARLVDPEPDFYDRVHLVAASSMLSHGVDVNRLNVMVMLGLPLATAEFIQTTSRVGRTHPGLVIVLHKIGRERDAAVYRTFPSFVGHADRLIDPIPITAKSRRVLELTFAGLVQARLYGIHEPAAIAAGLRQLTKPGPVRSAFNRLPVLEAAELQALVDMLNFDGPLDENLRRDLEAYLREFYRALNDPASSAEWVKQLFSTGEPMRSLRDVEAQAPVFSRGGRP
ncbi:helicase [Jiangella anatolica]|uniref:Helicase n=2 Tax=Jiangella anatolica TaxID=2670374 RepID=A0A2W2BDA1_9ACTN|nr:helicase [Jiangella anatolica]